MNEISQNGKSRRWIVRSLVGLVVLAALALLAWRLIGRPPSQPVETAAKPAQPAAPSLFELKLPPGKKPVIACSTFGGGAIAYTYLPTLLREKYGLVVTGVPLDKLVEGDPLAKFNAVILFEVGRLDPDTKKIEWDKISPDGLAKVSDTLYRYVENGGGLYLYSSAFTHCGDSWSSDTFNKFLKKFDAEVLFENMRDPSREKVQPDGAKLPYALADQIVKHPSTTGVRNYWYPVGTMGYGILGRPLVLGKGWEPLILTSKEFKSRAVELQGGYYPKDKEGAFSQFKGERAPVYAAGTFGKGRVILNGGFSTISFHGFGASEFADETWGRVEMEKGLNGIASDGLKLLISSLRWLCEPSLKEGRYSSYVLPARPAPDKAKPVEWKPCAPTDFGAWTYLKGVIGARPAVGGAGSGTVAEYAKAAADRKLNYIVCAGDFEKIEKKDWDQLVADCKTATSTNLLVMPALITRDERDNRFLQCGYKSWPGPEVLSKDQPKRVSDHLRYYFDCNTPLRAPFYFSKGTYPTWLYTAYNAFTAHTYENGKRVDDQFEGFLQSQHHGDRTHIIAIHLLGSPAEVAPVKELTYLLANSTEKLYENLLQSPFFGGAASFVTEGPRVPMWHMVNYYRQTFGDLYVPGTERWRCMLYAESDVPLKSVTIYDHRRVIRRFAVSGQTARIAFDGLNDNRHALTAVVEDEQGRRAITSTQETTDCIFQQYFCGDRCNIMNGQSFMRDKDGYHYAEPSTCQLYKGGRLHFAPAVPLAGLPGVDGSGSNMECFVYPRFNLVTADDAQSEQRPPVHQILRPYENADLIVFDTPILKRNDTKDREAFGHGPYVQLAEPRVGARLVQYHFLRRPMLVSPVLADVSMTITPPDGVQLKKGWLDFSMLLTESWAGRIRKYTVVRADGTQESGPADDESKGIEWKGNLRPGDGIVFPGVGEAFFLVDGGEFGAVLQCQPTKKWFRLWTGKSDTTKMAAGQQVRERVITLKVGNGLSDQEALAKAIQFRDGFGLTGKPPAYSVKADQGQVVNTRYLLEIDAKEGGFTGAISKADLPQRLPIQVNGVNDRWTAARVDLQRKEWFPLGVWNGATYTTIDTRDGETRWSIGNVVTSDHPDLFLTLLPANADGSTVVDVHNPTDKAVTAKVRIPLDTFLAKKQEKDVTVPAMASVQVAMER